MITKKVKYFDDTLKVSCLAERKSFFGNWKKLLASPFYELSSQPDHVSNSQFEHFSPCLGCEVCLSRNAVNLSMGGLDGSSLLPISSPSTLHTLVDFQIGNCCDHLMLLTKAKLLRRRMIPIPANAAMNKANEVGSGMLMAVGGVTWAGKSDSLNFSLSRGLKRPIAFMSTEKSKKSMSTSVNESSMNKSLKQKVRMPALLFALSQLC
jgi:hypothetical protein